MPRLTTKRLLLVGFLIGLLTMPALSALVVPSGQQDLADDESVGISDGVPFSAPNGMNLTITGDTRVDGETFVLDPDTVEITANEGTVEVSANGPAWAEINKDDIVGTWTKATSIDAQNDITINPSDKRKITVGDDIDSIEFRDTVQFDDGQIDFVYAGSSGSSKVILYNLPANQYVRAIDADTNSPLSQNQTTGSGTLVLDGLTNSEHSVRLESFTPVAPSLSDGSMSPTGTVRTETPQLSIDVSDGDLPYDNVTLEWYVGGTLENTTYATSNGTYSAEVGPLPEGDNDWYVVATDEFGNTDTSATKTFTVDHYDPQISNIQPSGDLQSQPSQISADISDADFAGDGDSLTVEFVLDGSQIDSQTIGSNQTVTTSMPSSGQLGGGHTIEIQVTDSYSQQSTKSATYNAPDTLYIRNELNHTELISANGEVRFFGADQVYSRTAPNGKVNMTNLPVNQEFIVEVQPTNGNFTTRTFYLESIYEQSSVYVLNTSAVNTINSRFILEDPTGNYDSETRLKIQKPIEINGNTQYQGIVIDQFGVEGVTATLQEGQRYRLSVASEDDSQTVGPYRADTSETVAVEPGTPTINLTVGEQGWTSNAGLDNRTLEYGYKDPEQLTDSVTVWIYERGNKSNKLQANQTYTSVGTATGIVSLTKAESQKEWRVVFIADRDGETIVSSEIVANGQDGTPPTGSNWTTMFAVGVLVLLAGAFSVVNAGIGAIIVSMAGGLLWWLGFLGGAASAITVSIAIFVSVLGKILTNR